MRVARARWIDWYVDDARSAVFVDGRVLVLSEIATAVLAHVVDEATADDLVPGLVELFGPPADDDPKSVTLSVLRDLVSCGVLVEVAS